MKVRDSYFDVRTGQTEVREIERDGILTEAEALVHDAAQAAETAERTRMAFLRDRILEAVLGQDGVSAADRTEYRQLRAKYRT